MSLRRESPNGSLVRSAAAGDPSFRQDYPVLAEYLELLVWEDGSPRQPSTLLIFCEDGCYKACVNDRAQGRVSFYTSATFTELLHSVEAGLAGGGADWRKAKSRR